MVGGAITTALIPGAASWLIYDRAAVLSGQFWRLFTGHWVHFSASHLAYDALALGIVGWIAEAQRLRGLGSLCLLAPWTINLAVLAFVPQMNCCAGLSGLVIAFIVFLVLTGLSHPPPWSWICRAALVGIAGKLGCELATGQMAFASVQNPQVAVSVPSHLAGLATAFAFYGWSRLPSRAG